MFAKMCQTHGMCSSYSNWAPLVLRVVLGVIIAVHGSQKLFGWFEGPGLEGTVGFFTMLGIMPAFFWAWVVALVEFVGGILLILGLGVRVVAPLVAINMLVALLKVHLARGFFVGDGGYEFVLILIAVAVSLALTGAGKISLDNIMCTQYCKTKTS